MTANKDLPKPLKKIGKDDVAKMYAKIIRLGEYFDEDFKALNSLIVTRWSVSGLEDIKKQAWKILEGS